MIATAGLNEFDGWERGKALRSLDPMVDLGAIDVLIKVVRLLDDTSSVSRFEEQLSAEDLDFKQWLLERRTALDKKREDSELQPGDDSAPDEIEEALLEEESFDAYSEEEAFPDEAELDNGCGSFLVSELARAVLDEWVKLDAALGDDAVLALFDATASELSRDSQTWVEERCGSHAFKDPAEAARSLALIAMRSGGDLHSRLEALGKSQGSWLLDQTFETGVHTVRVLETWHALHGEPALRQIVERLSDSAEPLDRNGFYFLLDPVFWLAKRDKAIAAPALAVLERLRRGGLGVVSGYAYLLDSSKREAFVAWLEGPDRGAYMKGFLELVGNTELPADFPGREVCRAAVKSKGVEDIDFYERYYESRADFLKAVVQYLDSDGWAFKLLEELAQMGEVARDAELSRRFFNGMRARLCHFDVDGRQTKRGHPHIWTTLSHIEGGWGDLVGIARMGKKRPQGMEEAVAGYLQDRQILVSQAARALEDWRPTGEQLQIVREACEFELEKVRVDLEWHRARGLSKAEYGRIHRSLSKGWAALGVFAGDNGLDEIVEKIDAHLERTEPGNLKAEDLEAAVHDSSAERRILPKRRER